MADSNTQYSQGRNESYDLISGLFIVHMVWYHILQFLQVDMSVKPWSYTWCLFFFMPWFFFKSGCYHKRVDTKSRVVKDFKKFLIPFAFYSLLGFIVHLIVKIYMGSFSLTWFWNDVIYCFIYSGAIKGNMALWFLSSLFVVKQIYNIVENKKLKMTLVLICIVCGYFCNRYSISLPLNMDGFFGGCFFYGCGDILKSYQHKRAICVASVFLCLYFLLCGQNVLLILKNELIQGCYVLAYINALAGILLVNNLTKHLHRPIPILSTIGRESMLFYVLHWPVLIIAKTIVVQCDIQDVCVGIFICVLVEIVLLGIGYTLNKNYKFV